MAFAYTTNNKTDLTRSRRIVTGAFTQASGDTGGAIVTGLASVDFFCATASLDDTDSSGTVTITTADPGAAQTGFWIAIGTR